jgi:hypothetical protein
MAESTDVTVARLEDQLAWYDAKAGRSQRMFKRLKAVTLIASALIPISVLCPYGRYIAAALGFVVVVVEGLQQLGQFQQNWFTYRATAEALKHEKYLYYAPAGDYADAKDPHRLLAEKIESLVSQEHARWSAAQEAALKDRQERKDAGHSV